MFSKILIANRGEIAVRVARTAGLLGIRSVAVYSSADINALHVEACDEAWCIGNAPASDSYLNAERILQVAQQCGAEAVHPGYGFLSENAAFARACEAVDIDFIGPPASAIDAMGSKSEAKALMAAAGVPLIPGYHGDDQADDVLANESRLVGYPQLIKASAGGGGKGMRLVESEAGFGEALASARREAKASFGDDRVLIERYLRKPRHVEMQVFADSQGNCVHLFERDCSIQRRHQKVLEEAPAPGLGEELRSRMGDAAINCARAIGYQGAGTVEFLLDADNSFYFMEMNTRLQVEHPVSEMITGQDLVEWQLRVAAGEVLPLQQAEIVMRGHALEARIYAETPERDFMPAAGRIGYLQLPGPDAEVRVDTGVRCGDEIGINYDPMIAKLIVHGDNRSSAIQKLAAALSRFQVLGPGTNLGFLARLVSVPEFVTAEIDTGFIATHGQQLFAIDEELRNQAMVLAAAACLPAFDNRECVDMPQSPWNARTQWRMNLPARQDLVLMDGESNCVIEMENQAGGWCFRFEQKDYRVNAHWIDQHRMRAEINGETVEFPVLREQQSIILCVKGQTFNFVKAVSGQGEELEDAVANNPRAPMSGVVVALPVAVGDTVAPGDTMVVVEAMKMEHGIVAQAAARISEIKVAIGDQVDEGDTLVLLEVE